MDLRDIVKRVRLVLDKSAARKLETDSKTALSKGTDPKKAKSNLRDVEGSMKRLGRTALKLGGALAAAFALNKIRQFGVEAVKAAAESDEIWNRLAGTVEKTGRSFEEVEGDIRTLARGMQDVTTVGDEDFAQILQSLITVTSDYEKSLENVGLAADIAAATGLDQARAAQYLGRIMNGETTALKRYGVELDETRDSLDQLRERFGGLAENEAKSLAGQTAQLKNEWGDLKQAVGFALIDMAAGGSILTTLRDKVKDLAIWIDENRGRISAWGRIFVEAVTAVAKVLGGLVKVAFNVGQAIGDALVGAASRIVGEFARAVSHLPFIEIDATPWLEESSARAASFVDQLHDIDSGLRTIASAWTNVAAAAEIAGENQERAASRSPGGGGGGGGGGAGAGMPSVTPGVTGTGSVVQGPQVRTGLVRLEEESTAFEDRWNETLESILGASQSAATGIAGAFSNAFGIMTTGFENVGDAAVALAKGIGSALLGGLADYASGKVAENVALAAEEFAKGTAAAANPFLAWSAPIHFSAAKMHAGTALKWSALAGIAGAASAGAAGGGGSFGSSGRARDLGGRQSEGSEPAGPEIHVHVDGIDPDSPRHQKKIGEAQRQYAERGGKLVVHNGGA